MPSIVVPEGFQYVAASLLSACWLLSFQAQTVSRLRKQAQVEYPRAYAEKAEQDASFAAMRFNCAQRAHQNTLEAIPTLFATTIISGLIYPIFAASACAWFVLWRIVYTHGYQTGIPKNRNRGALGGLGQLGLLLCASYIAFDWVKNGF